MPSFDIVKHSELKDSYRVQSVIGAFDLDVGKLDEHFSGNIDIEGKDWNVGLVARIMRSTSRQRITYSFVYVGEEGKERLK